MSILLALMGVAQAEIKVAVLEATSNETSTDVAAQLNDDTWFDFDATVVSVEDVDDVKELEAYDVIIVGGSGYGAPDWTSDFVSALDAWVRGGGSMVAVGWFHYTVDNASTYAKTMDALVPIDLSAGGYELCGETITLTVTKTSHPITTGLKDPSPTSSDYVEISSYALEKGAESLVTANGTYCSSSSTNNAVASWNVDDGSVVYAGITYSAASGYNNGDTRTGELDQLLEQAVNWAATGGDADKDGFSSAEDCDDDDPSINPDAKEIWYDGVDQNCDEMSDFDADLDGYDDAKTSSGDDCDDTDPDINPDATEIWYDGADQDCDGFSDYDQDLDGYDDAATGGGGDCDDLDPDINPLGNEVWYDGIDQNCDGNDLDADEDGYDSDEHGGDDCADDDPTISPGATEIWYDGNDQNCDGASDYDADGDGYDGNVDDCADDDPDISPAAEEIANDDIDQDCDGEDLIEDKEDPGTTCATVSGTGSAALLLVAAMMGLLRRRR